MENNKVRIENIMEFIIKSYYSKLDISNCDGNDCLGYSVPVKTKNLFEYDDMGDIKNYCLNCITSYWEKTLKNDSEMLEKEEQDKKESELADKEKVLYCGKCQKRITSRYIYINDGEPKLYCESCSPHIYKGSKD